MHKKVILISILILIVILAGGGFYYTQIRQQPTITTELSARSQSFLKKQQQSNSSLQYVNLTGPVGEDTRNKRIGRDGCYSFIIPYRVTSTRYEDTSGDTCSARFSFETPKGAINAYMYKKPITSWEDVSGVSYRRKAADEYEEEMKTINGKPFLLFKKKDTVYENNVFYYTADYFFVFNLITTTNEDLGQDLEGMLSTLEFEQ